MTTRIVQANQPVGLLGGGEAAPGVLDTLRAHTGPLVAADGGARHALAADLLPDAVIGDFDSLEPNVRARIPPDRLHHVPEQDSTDFEKCLSRISAPLVLAAGFMGPRTDHQLATFHGLLRCAHQPCILIGTHQIVCLCPPRVQFDASAGDLVSVFPMGSAQARSQGLEWPLDGVALEPGRMVGTSNRATGGSVLIETASPNLLLILPGPKLDALVTAVQQASLQWHARAE